MKTTKELNIKNKNSGITLIALVITIIVMLILVGLTIATVVKGGLFAKASNAGKQTNEAVRAEQERGTEGDKEYLGMDNEETDSGIGYYVYVDGQYGVIYADLAYDSKPNSQWGNSDGAYSWEAEDHDNLKKYYIDGMYKPEAEFGTAWEEKPLLVVDEEQGGTTDRFYVMALTDFTTEDYTTFDWDGGYHDILYETSTDFGTGADNTELLIGYWDEDEDNSWADQDIWKNLVDADRWFVPSRAEWSAFAQELDITSIYSNYGLSNGYWSSSQHYDILAWSPSFYGDYMDYDRVGIGLWVRLSTTF